MREDIVDLIDSYTNFIYKVTEYNVVNNKLKEYVRENHNNLIVDFYGLKLKSVDKSTYSKEVIPYLLENNLNQFIREAVSNKKINELMQENKIDRNFVLSNIENEKTALDIKLKNFPNDIDRFKNKVQYEVNNKEIINLVQRRECLKLEISDARYHYYKFVKKVKDILNVNKEYKHRFQYNSDIGMVKIRVTDRVYSDDFIKYLKERDLEAINFYVDSSKLIQTKSKKIDRKIVNKYKNYNFQEYLYVSVLRGLLNKKLRNSYKTN